MILFVLIIDLVKYFFYYNKSRQINSNPWSLILFSSFNEDNIFEYQQSFTYTVGFSSYFNSFNQVLISYKSDELSSYSSIFTSSCTSREAISLNVFLSYVEKNIFFEIGYKPICSISSEI